MSLFHIISLIFVPMPSQVFLPVHLFFVLTMLYLRYPLILLCSSSALRYVYMRFLK